MEGGYKLVIVAMVLLIILFSILTVFSNNFKKLQETSSRTDDHSADGLSDEWCSIRHGGDFFIVDKISGFGLCKPLDCNPASNTADNDCNPPAVPGDATTPTCCCKC